MRKYFLLITVTLLWLASLSQPQLNKADTALAREFFGSWVNDLYETGIGIKNDSLHINDEAKRIITDSLYRGKIYPAKYTWPEAIGLMKQMELKKTFWYFINLYADDTLNKKLILQIISLYDGAIDMEKALTAAFYTYSVTDPQVCSLQSAKPVITRPDILEKKLQRVREMVNYLLAYRKQKPASVKGG